MLHQYNEAQRSNPVTVPLTVPSTVYDTLRATLVQAELMLLRNLGFALRLPLPLDYLPRYLERAMEDIINAGEEYDRWSKEEQEEYGVVKNAMDTSLGRACRAKAISAWVTWWRLSCSTADRRSQRCQNYQLANLFPARAVAVGCLYLVMEDRGLRSPVTENSG